MRLSWHLPKFGRSASREEGTTIFLHIPKSAGQTLFKILDREYKQSNIYTFQGGRQRLAQSIGEFEKLPMAQRNKYLLLRGHMKFGIHQMITRPFTYITIIREPVARILSHYHYVLRTPTHALHKQVLSSGMGLKEYVANGLSTELNNGQVRLIAGVGSDLPFGQGKDDLLQEAIHNLETHFSVVGLTERFDDTILLMHQQLKWSKIPYYVKRNVTQSGAFHKRIDSEPIDVIRQYNALDVALYEHVFSGFEQTIAEKLPIDIQERFEYFNSLYRPYGQTMLRVSNWLRMLRP